SRPAVNGERDNFSTNSAGASRALCLITHLLFSFILRRTSSSFSASPVKKVLSGHPLHLWLSAPKEDFPPRHQVKKKNRPCCYTQACSCPGSKKEKRAKEKSRPH